MELFQLLSLLVVINLVAGLFKRWEKQKQRKRQFYEEEEGADENTVYNEKEKTGTDPSFSQGAVSSLENFLNKFVKEEERPHIYKQPTETTEKPLGSGEGAFSFEKKPEYKAAKMDEAAEAEQKISEEILDESIQNTEEQLYEKLKSPVLTTTSSNVYDPYLKSVIKKKKKFRLKKDELKRGVIISEILAPPKALSGDYYQ